MTNVCKNCGKTVTPDPDDGHCPKCGSRVGYTVSRTFTFSHKIEDGVSKYNKQIERLKKIQELYKGTKVEEKLDLEIRKFETIIRDLQNLLPKKPGKEVVISDEAKFTEEVIVEKKPETKTKSFTIDAVLIEADSKIKEGDELVDATNGDILTELRESRLENKKLHSKSTMLTILGLAGTFGGLFVGLFGGNFIKPIQIVFSDNHITPIINATNMTDIATTAINSSVIP